MKKSVILGIVFVAGVIALFLGRAQKTAVQQQAVRKELRTNFAGKIITFDPRIADDSDSLQMDYFLFCGLTTLDEKGNVKLDLAKSYQLSEDKKTYVFTLKEAFWSDGTPITAYDFEESWKEYTSDHFPASLWEMVSMIENKRGKTTTSQEPVGFVALDPTRLQIQLETPVSYFLQLLAHPALFPVHRSMRGVFSQHQPIDPHAIVCSGPFKIKSYKDQVEIILEKNTRYHDSSLVALERIYMSRITDPQTALALFEKGQLDWLGLPLSSLPVDAMEDLQKKGVLQVHPLLDTRFLYFNTKQYPFINVNLRRALTLAINREAIVKEVLHTSDFPALGYVPFAQKREKWHPFFQDHDEEGAKECFRQALAELHLKADELPEITLCYNTSDMWRRVIQVIQEQWRTVLGVRVKIENTDWHVHMDRLRHGQFQVARAGRSADFVDALSFLQHLLSFNTTQNFCRWENREFDQLLQLAESGRSDQERSLCLEKAEALMMQEMPIAPLVYLNAYTISHPDLKGVIVSPLYYVDFSKAYFESKK